MQYFECPKCLTTKAKNNFQLDPTQSFPLISVCNDCLNQHFVEKVDCTCSVCRRKLPHTYFQHYKTRIKSNGMRLRVNTNCKDCSKKESSVLRKIKLENPAPSYGNQCPQCDKVVYEKVEDIPDGVDGTNGPWQCDHDHKSGEFRGYLCKRCNTGTGLIGDNQDYWESAKKRKKIKTKKTD